jgi:polynucleotide 5'-hydroxyl-kinase GRC3/NOL9
LETPPDWAAALARIAGREKRRVVVIGATDSGKSSFIRAAMGAAAEAGIPLNLIDLDPGQKMLGPPGTATLGDGHCLRRLIFLGSTSASEIYKIVDAAGALADEAVDGFIANTSGFVRGLGARLQSLTISRLAPDLLVVLGDRAALAPILEAHPHVPTIRLGPAPAARRKSPAERRGTRQAAFDRALEHGERLHLNAGGVSFAPAPPAPFDGPARPVCALLDGRGEAMGVGVLERAEGGGLTMFAKPPPRPVHLLQLGKMWAEPSEDGWRLLERLGPSWLPNG